MSADIGFGYAQARLHACLARLPSESDWERLAATRTLASFLEEARVGVFGGWVKGLSAHSRPRDLERGVRELGLEQIERLAHWVPPPWRSAVAWTAWLPWLPLIESLSRGETPPAVLAQENPSALSRAPPETLVHGLTDDAGWRELVGPMEAAGVGERWRSGWRARWPGIGSDARARLEALARLIEQHLATFRASRPESAWETRRLLRAALRLSFHRNPLQPAAVFVYLGILWLDLERLRGELVRRALFGLESSL